MRPAMIFMGMLLVGISVVTLIRPSAGGAAGMNWAGWPGATSPGSSFRSGVVFLCALVVAGLALSTVLIVRGAEDSLRLALDGWAPTSSWCRRGARARSARLC